MLHNHTLLKHLRLKPIHIPIRGFDFLSFVSAYQSLIRFYKVSRTILQVKLDPQNYKDGRQYNSFNVHAKDIYILYHYTLEVIKRAKNSQLELPCSYFIDIICNSLLEIRV